MWGERAPSNHLKGAVHSGWWCSQKHNRWVALPMHDASQSPQAEENPTRGGCWHCHTLTDRGTLHYSARGSWQKNWLTLTGWGRQLNLEEARQEKKEEKAILAAVQGATEMNVIEGHSAACCFHLQPVAQERAAPCTHRNNFCITPLVLVFLCFAVGQNRSLLGILTSPLSQPAWLIA